ncbi:uracil-DNA glycosylase [Anopheles sinensis]|uniref:Uracil-DNA glycosylase n=1 Tax=Anopheles sinensis TaxID=74873 RepID=A0A084VWN8_ANOSI|nr:uracil-DNA glycosylase [Anopheles sinensis]
MYRSSLSALFSRPATIASGPSGCDHGAAPVWRRHSKSTILSVSRADARDGEAKGWNYLSDPIEVTLARRRSQLPITHTGWCWGDTKPSQKHRALHIVRKHVVLLTILGRVCSSAVCIYIPGA